MQKIGFNMEKVKINNSASILRILNRKGPMSRKDIAAELGLTPAAVTILCNDMIAQKVIISKGEVADNSRVGRKKVLIDINYQNKKIISISIQPIHTFIYFCDMKGNPIQHKMIRTNNQTQAESFLKVVAEEVQQLLTISNMNWDSVSGIGVTVTGIVDSEQGISKHAYGIWNEVVPIKAILENMLPTHVAVGNNVKAFAEAELLFESRKSIDHILFVKWGPGVGSSIAIRNNTYEGKDFMAGELGHYVVDPNGKLCRCGRRGCLETKVSYQAILEKIKLVFTPEKMPVLYAIYHGDIRLLEKEIIENDKMDYLLETCEPEVDLILRECIGILALSVVNAITILAPNEVIVLSPLFARENYFTYFLECCNSIDGNRLEQCIHKSKFENAIHYIGGVAISVKHDFFNRGGLDD